MERLSARERERIGELVAEGAPFWRLLQEVPRSRYAIYRAVKRLKRPPAREPNRSPLRLSTTEREEISRGLAAGESLRVIAGRLARAPSTVSREVARNGGRPIYRACRADRAAVRNMRRPKVAKLTRCPRLREAVEAKLELHWSPQQIASWLVLEFPDDAEMRVSHETIYLSLFVQSRGGLRKELTRYLRMKRSVRRPGGKPPNTGQSHIPAMVNIRERPAEAQDRAVPGHWEGDLLYGQGPGVVATLVERHSRFVMLVGLPENHRADVVAAALAAKITELPEHLRRSLAWDQGREMAQHANFTVASGVPVYFCDPRSPWQRGSNENTNGLLRQYLPRNSRLGDRTQIELDAIADELNGRPRQTLGWMTPSQTLDRAML
ncbi:MAG TPA: IS30 family transposase [Jiangellaceae bacterium]